MIFFFIIIVVLKLLYFILRYLDMKIVGYIDLNIEM